MILRLPCLVLCALSCAAFAGSTATEDLIPWTIPPAGADLRTSISSPHSGTTHHHHSEEGHHSDHQEPDGCPHHCPNCCATITHAAPGTDELPPAHPVVVEKYAIQQILDPEAPDPRGVFRPPVHA